MNEKQIRQLIRESIKEVLAEQKKTSLKENKMETFRKLIREAVKECLAEEKKVTKK